MRIFCLVCLVLVSSLSSAYAQENISTGNAEDNSAVVAGSDGISDSAESVTGNSEDEQKALRTSYFTRVRVMFFVLLVCAITLPWIVFRKPSPLSSDE